jgi:AraC family transcriptional activator of mtrCDE
MANLSDFLHQIHANSGDWVAIELRGDQRLLPARCDELLFYIVLDGEVRMAIRASGSLALVPSDVAIIFGGIAHQIETGAPDGGASFDYFGERHDLDIPPVLGIGNGALSARLLVGRIGISWPIMLRPAGLPPYLHLRMGPTEASAAEIVALFTRAMTGAGASAYLTKLAELAMLRTLRENVELISQLPPDAASLQITRALTLIDAAPGEDWSLNRMAREVGMSRSTFAEKFVKLTGKRPMEVVADARMRAAATLLEAGQAGIEEVAARVGYRSEAAFSRRFQRHFGVAPGRYRRDVRRDQRLARPQLFELAGLGQLP